MNLQDRSELDKLIYSDLDNASIIRCAEILSKYVNYSKHIDFANSDRIGKHFIDYIYNIYTRQTLLHVGDVVFTNRPRPIDFNDYQKIDSLFHSYDAGRNADALVVLDGKPCGTIYEMVNMLRNAKQTVQIKRSSSSCDRHWSEADFPRFNNISSLQSKSMDLVPDFYVFSFIGCGLIREWLYDWKLASKLVRCSPHLNSRKGDNNNIWYSMSPENLHQIVKPLATREYFGPLINRESKMLRDVRESSSRCDYHIRVYGIDFYIWSSRNGNTEIHLLGSDKTPLMVGSDVYSVVDKTLRKFKQGNSNFDACFGNPDEILSFR